VFVDHDELDARRPRLVGLGRDRQQGGQGAVEGLEPVFDGTGRDDAAASGPARGRVVATSFARPEDDLVDPAHTGDLRHAQLLGRLRPDLGGVAVDRLAAAEHEVEGADLLDRLRQGVAGGQRVGAGEGLVGQQDHLVGAAVQRLAQHGDGGRRAHRDDGHAAAVAVLELERLLEGVEVLGVEHGRQRGAVDRAVLLHRVTRHVGGVGDLLDEDDEAQRPGTVWLVAHEPRYATRSGAERQNRKDLPPQSRLASQRSRVAITGGPDPLMTDAPHTRDSRLARWPCQETGSAGSE